MVLFLSTFVIFALALDTEIDVGDVSNVDDKDNLIPPSDDEIAKQYISLRFELKEEQMDGLEERYEKFLSSKNKLVPKLEGIMRRAKILEKTIELVEKAVAASEAERFPPAWEKKKATEKEIKDYAEMIRVFSRRGARAEEELLEAQFDLEKIEWEKKNGGVKVPGEKFRTFRAKYKKENAEENIKDVDTLIESTYKDAKKLIDAEATPQEELSKEESKERKYEEEKYKKEMEQEKKNKEKKGFLNRLKKKIFGPGKSKTL